MKLAKHWFILLAIATLISSCKDTNKDDSTTSLEVKAETESAERTGQAFIKNDGSTTVLSIAIDSKDHTTLVAAVQAAQLENALVNAGP
jgi:hypothetical protein